MITVSLFINRQRFKGIRKQKTFTKCRPNAYLLVSQILRTSLWRPVLFASCPVKAFSFPSPPPTNSSLHFSRYLQIPGHMKPFLWKATQGHSSSGGHNTPFHRGLALKFHRWWEGTADTRSSSFPSEVMHQSEGEQTGKRCWLGTWWNVVYDKFVVNCGLRQCWRQN